MKIVHKDQAGRFKNGDHCLAIEYPFGDKDINGTVIELTGRYPEKGRVVNLECKELVYVINGSGKVVVEGEEIDLREGDSILIEPGEKYFWNGSLTLFLSCTPAWYPGQHEEVE